MMRAAARTALQYTCERNGTSDGDCSHLSHKLHRKLTDKSFFTPFGHKFLGSLLLLLRLLVQLYQRLSLALYTRLTPHQKYHYSSSFTRKIKGTHLSRLKRNSPVFQTTHNLLYSYQTSSALQTYTYLFSRGDKCIGRFSFIKIIDITLNLTSWKFISTIFKRTFIVRGQNLIFISTSCILDQIKVEIYWKKLRLENEICYSNAHNTPLELISSDYFSIGLILFCSNNTFYN